MQPTVSTRLALTATVLFWIVGVPPSTANPNYTFETVDVATPNGNTTVTSLADINQRGEIVGGFTITDSNNPLQGYVLDRRQRVTRLTCLPEQLGMYAHGLNQRGDTVGALERIVGYIPTLHPPFQIPLLQNSGFVLESHGHCTVLDVPGAVFTEATGINDVGTVIGDYRDANGVFHGFVWTEQTFWTLDVPFTDAAHTMLSSINPQGDILGSYLDTDISANFPNGHLHNFTVKSGVFVVVPDVPGATDTIATALSYWGDIAGIFLDTTGQHGFVRRGRQVTVIDVPFNNVVLLEIAGLNDQGQLVGRYLVPTPNDPTQAYASHGFVATPGRLGRGIVGKRFPFLPQQFFSTLLPGAFGAPNIPPAFSAGFGGKHLGLLRKLQGLAE